MKYSYSNVSLFKQCPYRWYLRYKEKLKTIPETNADNALWLGLGLHKGIETTVEQGVAEYQSHFNVLTDDIVNWSIQLEYWIPKVKELLPEDGNHEVEINTEDYIGFIDYVTDDTIFDFKFTTEKNMARYLQSPQLSIYKHYYEQCKPNINIKHLKYILIPKVSIRQKKTESIDQFRQRLYSELDAKEVSIAEVPFDIDSIAQFVEQRKVIENATNYPKNPTRLCDWCDFKKYCQSDGQENWMIL
jgi:hypothetical protein